MIFVCEPTVTGASHEKVNCGFLKGLQLAYPDEPMTVFADPTHVAALTRLAPIDGLDLSRVHFKEVPFGAAAGFAQYRGYRTQLREIFSLVVAAERNRIFFLSGNPPVLVQAKRLLEGRFAALELCFVLHASFEDVAADGPTPLPLEPLPGSQRVAQKLKERGVRGLLSAVARRGLRAMDIPGMLWRRFVATRLSTRHAMEWRHSERIRYVALSPHVVANARRYVHVNRLNVRAVVLPTVFRPAMQHFPTDRVRFAVFGYGNASMLYNVMLRLRELAAGRPYEVRIIGMDNRGMAEFPEVNAVSPGRFMNREEMEAHVEDIDLFLILYDRSRYRLSCSNAVLEALSYFKPIVHLENDCIDFFSPPEAPIGYRATSVEEYAERMADLIHNFPERRGDLERFGANLAALRERYSIESQAAAIRAAFEGGR